MVLVLGQYNRRGNVNSSSYRAHSATHYPEATRLLPAAFWFTPPTFTTHHYPTVNHTTTLRHDSLVHIADAFVACAPIATAGFSLRRSVRDSPHPPTAHPHRPAGIFTRAGLRLKRKRTGLRFAAGVVTLNTVTTCCHTPLTTHNPIHEQCGDVDVFPQHRCCALTCGVVITVVVFPFADHSMPHAFALFVQRCLLLLLILNHGVRRC